MHCGIMESKNDDSSSSQTEVEKSSSAEDTPTFGFGTSNASFSQLKKTSDTPFWKNDDSSKTETTPEAESTEKVEEEQKLAPVAVCTGEEEEETLVSYRSKLFYISKGKSEWSEKGAGSVRVNEDSAGLKRLSTYQYP